MYLREERKNVELQKEIEELKEELHYHSRVESKIDTNFAIILENINKIKYDVSLLTDKSALQSLLLHEQSKIAQMKSLLNKFIAELEFVYECPIKRDKIVDPVSTPNGVTYENFMIMKHLKSSKFDPLTKQRLNPSKLVPNLAIKKLISVVNKFRDTIDKIDFTTELSTFSMYNTESYP